MLLNCGVAEDPWESLGLQRDPTSQSWKKSVLNIHWKDWCWSSNTLATWCEELTQWKRSWCWERLKAGGEGDDRGWDGWMVSLTWWTWVWASSRSWWWTGRPHVLQYTGLQRVRHDWVTELNWKELIKYLTGCLPETWTKRWPIANELEMTGLFWFNTVYRIEKNKEFEMLERISHLRPNQHNWRIPRWLSGKEFSCLHKIHSRKGFNPWVEDPLEEKMANHFSVLAWKIPWAEEQVFLPVYLWVWRKDIIGISGTYKTLTLNWGDPKWHYVLPVKGGAYADHIINRILVQIISQWGHWFHKPTLWLFILLWK